MRFFGLILGCSNNDIIITKKDDDNKKKSIYNNNDDDENKIVALDLIVKPNYNNNNNGIRKNINIPLVAVIDTSNHIVDSNNTNSDVSNINDDLLLFLSNIDIEKDKNTMTYEYSYKTNTLNTLITNNSLLQVLSNVIMNNNNNNNVIDIKQITMAIDISIEVTTSKFMLGFTLFQNSPSSSPIANYSNTSLALDGIVIVLDILQSAILKLIDNLNFNKIDSSIMLFGPLEKLFSNLGEVATSVSCCTDLKSKEIWCQSVKKSSQIIVVLAEINLTTIKRIKKGNNSIQSVIQLVSLLQSLAATTMITMTISDSNSRIFSALSYWSACCHTITNLELFLTHCTKTGQLDEKPGYPVGRSSHDYQLKTIVTSIIGRVMNSLAQANFNPKELYAEICRMKHGRNHNIVSVIHKTIDEELVDLDPYQIRYILFGLHKMLLVKSFASRILKNPHTLKLPRTTEWMTSIAESLMLCISYGPLKLKGESAFEENEDQSGKISLKLAPFLAELLLQLCNNCDDYEKVDWIFIELSRYLSAFTDFLRRIRKFSKTARYLHASSASSLPSVGSVESNIDDQPMLDDSYDSCSFYSLANPVNFTKGRSPRTESSSPLLIEKDKPKFNVNDLVDGYCSTQNGSYRWFPGTVKGVNSDRTYTIVYKDGDENKDKKESELRLSKRIGSKARSSSSNDPRVPPLVPKLGFGSTRNVTSRDAPQRTETSSPTVSERTKLKSPYLSTPDFNISPMTKYDNDLKTTDYGFKLNLPSENDTLDYPSSPKSILSDDSDNNIFEIPSVFKDTERSDRSVSFVKNKDIVPRMQFEDLSMSGSFQMPNASQSLSSDLFGGILNDISMEKQVTEKKATSSRSGDIYYQGTDRSKDDGGSNATRLLSWRDESSRLSGQSTSRLGLLVPRPLQNGPSLEMISSQEAVQRLKLGQLSSFPVASSARSGKSINSCRIPISLSESFEDLDEHTLSIFVKTLSIVSAILITRSISSDSSLQYSCCISRETAEFATNPNGERKKVLSNILFSVRDFLDVVSSSDSKSVISLLVSICNITDRAMMRLIKLSTPMLFQNCFIKHSEKGVRIGQGGFGSINRVTCDCNLLDICQQCIWSRPKGSTIIQQSQRVVAIKRVGRERSAYDNPMFYDIFQEISCLEMFASLSCNGVCKLIDYGIVHAEYWIIMECGKYNLKEWRSEHLNNSKSFESDVFLSDLELRRCLVYFLDALLIVQHVHNCDIAHFDIKCENFIVRTNESTLEQKFSNDEVLNVENMLNSHKKGSCSGRIFIADFGESVYQESSLSIDKPFKSRGTLTIQSPEMIALTEKTDSSRKNQKSFARPNKKSDIWSLGCMLYELLTGEYLFYEKSWPELFVNFCMVEMVPLSFNGFEKIASVTIRSDIESILRRMLKQDAEDRILIKDLIVELYDLIQKLNDTHTKVIENLIKDDTPAAVVDVTIPSQEQIDSSLLMSISSTVFLRKQLLDCSVQKLYLNLKSKYQINEGLMSDSQPDQVINKMVKDSSLTNAAENLISEKLKNIYVNTDGYYEVDIVMNHEGVTMDNQIHITNNSVVLIENINNIISNCMRNIKQGKVVVINLYSTKEEQTIEIDQYTIIQITVAISLIEYLSTYGFDKLELIGECRGCNKIQSISPWIYENCNYEILNFIFANITL